MSKKILCSIAPILVLAALAVAPSIASARRAFGTESGGTFTAFPLNTPEAVVKKAAGNGKLVFETSVGIPRGIECNAFSGKGTVENVVRLNSKGEEETVGINKEKLVFRECNPFAIVAGCREINPKTPREITGEVTGEVSKNGKKAELTFHEPGFQVSCLFEEHEEGRYLGSITGMVKGTFIGDSVEFNKTESEFSQKDFEIWTPALVGIYVTETEAGKKNLLSLTSRQ